MMGFCKHDWKVVECDNDWDTLECQRCHRQRRVRCTFDEEFS